jgi:hypothetical protein
MPPSAFRDHSKQLMSGSTSNVVDDENSSRSGSLETELLSPSNSFISDNVIITADWLDRNAYRNGCSVSIFIGVRCPVICKPKMTKDSSNPQTCCHQSYKTSRLCQNCLGRGASCAFDLEV